MFFGRYYTVQAIKFMILHKCVKEENFRQAMS